MIDQMVSGLSKVGAAFPIMADNYERADSATEAWPLLGRGARTFERVPAWAQSGTRGTLLGGGMAAGVDELTTGQVNQLDVALGATSGRPRRHNWDPWREPACSRERIVRRGSHCDPAQRSCRYGQLRYWIGDGKRSRGPGSSMGGRELPGRERR